MGVRVGTMSCGPGQSSSSVAGKEKSKVSNLLSTLPTLRGVDRAELEKFRRLYGRWKGVMEVSCWAGQSSKSGWCGESPQSGVSSLLYLGLSVSVGK